MSASVRWRRREDVIWRYTGDGIVLLSLDASELTALDGSGTVVWQELREPQTLSSLCRRVADRVGSDADSVETEVRQLLLRLSAHRVAESCDD